MTLANTTFIPELQYWFNQYVQNSSVNRYEIPMPVSIPIESLTSNSVISLLFNKTYQHSDYIYKYREETNRAGWPDLVRQRLMIYASSKYLVADNNGTNIFNLQNDDLIMLDALTIYRNDSSGLVIADVVGLSLVTNPISHIATLSTTYNSLTTKLSKLIYLYLDLLIRENYENYNNIDIVTCGTLLETCFELFVLDVCFDFVTNNAPQLGIECSPTL